jgi:predicted permease
VTVRLLSAASPMNGYKAGESYVAVISFFLMVGLVLAVACANTANLLLAAAVARRGEMGVRLALGASTGRLVRQMVTESLALGLVAGGLGYLMAFWLVPSLGAVLALSPEFSAAPDGRVLVFTIAVALLCGLGAGLSPARFGARGRVLSALKSDNGAAATPAPSRLRTSFVGFQAAVSIFLLVAAGLFARTALVTLRVDPGFDADRLIALSIEPPRTGFDAALYLRQAKAIVSGLPSVEAVSISEYQLFGWSRNVRRFTHEGRSYEINITRADEDFFAAAGMKLLRGRTISAADVATSAPVAVISESVARAFFGTSDPIGQPLPTLVSVRGQPDRPTVIGVVADAILTSFRSQMFGSMFQPFDLVEQTRESPPSLVIRTAKPAVAIRAVESALQSLDSRVRPASILVQERLDQFLGSKRQLAVIAVPSALLVLLLATLGVFGVSAFAVSQRTQEVSLRLAIGASASDILMLLMKDNLRPVLTGLTVGLVLAIAASRVAASQFFSGISPYDPVAIGVSTAILLAAATAAVIVPARRAARTDPAPQLRHS